MYQNHCIIILFLYLPGIFFITSCGSTQTFTPHQMDAVSLEIDGNITGWPTGETNVYRDDFFNYHVMRDSEYLYIYVDFLSPFHNEAARKSGLILYMSPEHENRRNKGLGFPSGSFNMLRENPATFRELTTNMEWLNNTQNHRLLEDLEEDIFERILIVERYDGSNAQYGFVTRDQIEAQGMELAVSTERRYFGLEYKIPLDRSAPFELVPGQTYWLGFVIDPPDFRYRDDTEMTTSNRYGTGQFNRQQGRRSTTADLNQMMRREFGQHENWFKIRITE